MVAGLLGKWLLGSLVSGCWVVSLVVVGLLFIGCWVVIH